eukprot:993164-Prorocentrum_minimum.AAC.2
MMHTRRENISRFGHHAGNSPRVSTSTFFRSSSHSKLKGRTTVQRTLDRYLPDALPQPLPETSPLPMLNVRIAILVILALLALPPLPLRP